jgi:hypothetical protein
MRQVWDALKIDECKAGQRPKGRPKKLRKHIVVILWYCYPNRYPEAMADKVRVKMKDICEIDIVPELYFVPDPRAVSQYQLIAGSFDNFFKASKLERQLVNVGCHWAHLEQSSESIWQNSTKLW